MAEDVIKRVLQECDKLAKTEPGRELLTGIRKEIDRADREIDNLTQAIAAGGPIEELVERLMATKTKRKDLQLQATWEGRVIPLEKVVWEDIEQAIEDLRGTLGHATTEEKRDLLQENITGISIPRTGRALLEANPAGLFKTAGVLLYGDPEGSRNSRKLSRRDLRAYRWPFRACWAWHRASSVAKARD